MSTPTEQVAATAAVATTQPGAVAVGTPVARGGYEKVQSSEDDASHATAVVVDAAIPAAVATPMVEVISPATLREGSTFDAEIGGRTITVTVPIGGVEEGQRFSVPFPALRAGDANVPGAAGGARLRQEVPVGHWKDGVCDCCRYGPFTPVVWSGWCCHLIILGQIMTRMNLSWTAQPGDVSQVARTFKVALFLTIGYFVVWWLVRPATQAIAEAMVDDDTYSDDDDDYPVAVVFVYTLEQIIHFCFWVLVVVGTCLVRNRIRRRYAIPATACPDLAEDFCCSLWCNSCTLCQMARHTADYDVYPSECCTSTGLPAHAPALV